MPSAINNTILTLKESATLGVNQKALRMRKEGVDVCHLGFGESPFPVPEIMVEALTQSAGIKNYLPGLGLPELRKEASDFLCKGIRNPKFLGKHSGGSWKQGIDFSSANAA